MEKINFQNGITPLNDTNLNQLQDNMEESCVVVSPTQPTTNEKVWIQKGKNLNKISGFHGIGSDFGVATIKLKVKENTDYTISATKSRVGGGNIGNVWFQGIGGVKAYDVSRNQIADLFRENAHSLENGSIRIDYAITTPANCDYIVVDFSNNNGDYNLNTSVTEIQVEQGLTATEYEPYIEKKILCKNDNGVFEEFYKNEDTGWIDLSQYVNSHVVSIREGYPPMARKINDIVYLRGEVYIATEPQNQQFNILERLPSYLIPTYQVTGGGVTFLDFTSYSIWMENGNITVCTANKGIQSHISGFDLCNIAPYIVD